jgi:hypothetical protein
VRLKGVVNVNVNVNVNVLDIVVVLLGLLINLLLLLLVVVILVVVVIRGGRSGTLEAARRAACPYSARKLQHSARTVGSAGVLAQASRSLWHMTC